MPFKFNPLTGSLDLVKSSETASTSFVIGLSGHEFEILPGTHGLSRINTVTVYSPGGDIVSTKVNVGNEVVTIYSNILLDGHTVHLT